MIISVIIHVTKCHDDDCSVTTKIIFNSIIPSSNYNQIELQRGEKRNNTKITIVIQVYHQSWARKNKVGECVVNRAARLAVHERSVLSVGMFAITISNR